MTTALLLSCVKIFCCRILDVTCGTIRTMLTVKEKVSLAAMVGFVEVFIWYVVVKDAMASTGPVIANAIAYAGGYASGTYIGGRLSKLLISGNVTVQVVTSGRNEEMLEAIRSEGFAITVIKANESEFSGKKYLILASIDKKQYKKYEQLIKKWDEGAFILVNDTKNYEGGYFGK